MKKYHLSLQWKFLLSITLIILPTLGIIFTWEGIQREKRVTHQMLNQAKILARQVILTRHWISDCGGVFVPRDSIGAKGTIYFLDDKLETPVGCYQKFTPSMVTKKLSQYSLRQDIYQFRPASLNPLNPENKADDFEKVALEKFRKEGLKKDFKIEQRGDGEFLHYIVPLTMDKTCLNCHKSQGFSEGSVGGGLSIFLPIGRMR